MATKLGKQFGRYVARRRKKADMTYRDLARKSRIPVATLFAIESGTVPKLTNVAQLAKAFGEDVPMFLSPVFVKAPRAEAAA